MTKKSSHKVRTCRLEFLSVFSDSVIGGDETGPWEASLSDNGKGLKPLRETIDLILDVRFDTCLLRF
jgi:hypothetical protein